LRLGREEFLEFFYFGPSDTYLFGAYHSPKLSNRREGIVLCSPFGQENMRAHRSLRRLAINLSNLGYAVLRFDYRGTGDSAGTLDGVTADDWQQDIRIAIQELIDIAAVPNVSLLGLRVGALLAAQVAASHQYVSRLVMWDPVVSGQAYIDELNREIKAAQSRANFIATDGTLHFNGFSMPCTFQQSLKGLDIHKFVAGLDATAVAQIVSHENDSFTNLYASFSKLQRFVYELAPAPHDWNYVDNVGGILWPQPVLQAIENYFSVSQR
jgi:alpha-beta hydrolase superfamily lysophospholipase